MTKQNTAKHTPAKQFRLGPEILEMLDAMAHHYSVDRTSMLKVIITDYFKRISGIDKKPPKKSLLGS